MAIYDLEGTLGAGEIPSNYFHEAIQTRELTDSECQRRDQDKPVNSQEMDERNGGMESQHVRVDEAQLGRRPTRRLAKHALTPEQSAGSWTLCHCRELAERGS